MPPSRCVPAVWWICNSNVTTAKDGGCKIYPKKYLQASFEVFLSMLVVSWAATLAFNTDIVESNRIKDVFGYNNVCVGFDMEPAKYFVSVRVRVQGGGEGGIPRWLAGESEDMAAPGRAVPCYISSLRWLFPLCSPRLRVHLYSHRVQPIGTTSLRAASVLRHPVRVPRQPARRAQPQDW